MNRYHEGRAHAGVWMTVHEAERLAELWCAGQPLDDLPQWRTAMQVLARELADTRAALKRRGDALEWYRDEAKALAKNITGGAHTAGVLASLTVLVLDAGRRADTALQLNDHDD
jgi:hypothetical protein